MMCRLEPAIQPVAEQLALSALVAALPVIVLLGLLGLLRARAHYAALAGLATALLVALLVYGMPAPMATAALVNGALFGLFPIGWIVLTAMFVYDITVATGAFEVVKGSIAGMASDRRIQVLLIAFCFGAFLEGSAGFGTPVAICAAMLIGLGFRPLPAAGLSLIGNTAPVAFGAIGTPILTLAGVTSQPVDTLSAMVGRQLPFFALIVPFWLVWALAGRKATFEVWPAALTVGVSFGLVQFLVSNFIGPELVDILASLVSIGSCCSCSGSGNRGRSGASSTSATTPRRRPPSGRRAQAPPTAAARPTPCPHPAGQATGLGAVGDARRDRLPLGAAAGQGLPERHLQRQRQRPLPRHGGRQGPTGSCQPSPTAAVFAWTPLSATGTALLFTAIGAALHLRLRPGEVGRILLGTLNRVKTPLLTIAAMLAIATQPLRRARRLHGAGVRLHRGAVRLLLAPARLARRGPDRQRHVVQCPVRQPAADHGPAGGLSPVLTTAANSSGGVMAKMIDAQSIVVAEVATGQQGSEGEILRYGFWHAVALGCLMGVLVFRSPTCFPG